MGSRNAGMTELLGAHCDLEKKGGGGEGGERTDRDAGKPQISFQLQS